MHTCVRARSAVQVRGFHDFLQDFWAEARAAAAPARRDLHLVCVSNKPSYDFQALQVVDAPRASGGGGRTCLCQDDV